MTKTQIQNMIISEKQNKLNEVSVVLVEMRARSQITLPSEITKKIGIQEGDRFEVMERDGGVFLCPVVVYPKNKLENIAKIIKDHEQEPSVVYSSVEDMFNDLGISLSDYNVQS